MVKLKDIKIFYKFKPSISIWISKSKGKSYHHKLLDETWYEGYIFNTGYFFYIQCKIIAIHIRIEWWKFKF